MTTKEARYQNIAYEIAKRIVARRIKEGDKLRGRSVLAGEYEVSSETIRKAMRLLSNLGVVEVVPRSGIYVISENAAQLYIEQYRKQSESYRLFRDTISLLEKSRKNQNLLEAHIKKLLETSKNDIFPFDFFTYKLSKTDKHIGKNLKEIALWNKTTGLVLAVEYDGQLYQSPNPQMPLEKDMILYILGDERVKEKTIELFKNGESLKK